LQGDPEITRSRDGDGNGPQEETREPDEEDTVRQRPIDLAEQTIHERGEEFYLYGEEQKAKSARIKLAELGWARRSDGTDDEMVVPKGATVGDTGNVDRDPVARYTASFEIGSVQRLTATEIFQWGGRVLSKGEQIPPDWPADSREVHEHLSRLAPILQTTKRQHPYFEGDSYPCEEPPEVREGYTQVEYWEKEAGDKEGIWVFAVHEPGEPVDREEVEDYVWIRVKPLEKVIEHFLELPGTFDASEEASDDGEYQMTGQKIPSWSDRDRKIASWSRKDLLRAAEGDEEGDEDLYNKLLEDLGTNREEADSWKEKWGWTQLQMRSYICHVVSAEQMRMLGID
jgi:hypothetical protein